MAITICFIPALYKMLNLICTVRHTVLIQPSICVPCNIKNRARVSNDSSSRLFAHSQVKPNKDQGFYHLIILSWYQSTFRSTNFNPNYKLPYPVYTNHYDSVFDTICITLYYIQNRKY